MNRKIPMWLALFCACFTALMGVGALLSPDLVPGFVAPLFFFGALSGFYAAWRVRPQASSRELNPWGWGLPFRERLPKLILGIGGALAGIVLVTYALWKAGIDLTILVGIDVISLTAALTGILWSRRTY